jgi:hypothetical protein
MPVTCSLAILASAWLSNSASAAQTYTVGGRDSFSIGAGAIESEVTYEGTETLTVKRHGKFSRLSAHVKYKRSDGAASTDASGDYLADVLPTGETIDSADRDPDYLTVLNQPFSARLDHQTLDDLEHLQGALPFDFPSPITGSSLHGYLQHLAGGMVGPRRSTGVRFEAAGPMRGELPDRPGLTLIGTIAMRGTAYYDIDTATLLALETTVTITGTVSNRTGKDPVTIVYARAIRASPPSEQRTARSPQPQPAASPEDTP